MSEEHVTFYAPALFVLFFVMAAMALVVAPISWIYKSCSSNPPAHDPMREVLVFQFRNLAGMAFLSFIVNFLRFLEGGPGGVMQFMPEALLLSFMGWRSLVYTREQGRAPHKRLLSEGLRVALQFGLCLVGWGLTFAAGFAFYLVALNATQGDGGAAAMGAGFFTGGLWIGSVIIVFFFFKKRAHDPAKAMEGYRFHDLLWPVMLAFVALLIPLMIQDFGNSEKFHEMMHSKRPPRRI